MAMKITGDLDMVKKEKSTEKEHENHTLVDAIDTKVNDYLETQRTFFTRVGMV